jgi:hypothetical protein
MKPARTKKESYRLAFLIILLLSIAMFSKPTITEAGWGYHHHTFITDASCRYRIARAVEQRLGSASWYPFRHPRFYASAECAQSGTAAALYGLAAWAARRSGMEYGLWLERLSYTPTPMGDG